MTHTRTRTASDGIYRIYHVMLSGGRAQQDGNKISLWYNHGEYLYTEELTIDREAGYIRHEGPATAMRLQGD